MVGNMMELRTPTANNRFMLVKHDIVGGAWLGNRQFGDGSRHQIKYPPSLPSNKLKTPHFNDFYYQPFSINPLASADNYPAAYFEPKVIYSSEK